MMKKKKIINFIRKLGAKYEYFILFIIFFSISWLIYVEYFIKLFSYEIRFIPTFLLGFIAFYLIMILTSMKRSLN